MKKKKRIWYLLLCCVILLATFMFPILLDTATGTFVEIIVGQREDRETETERNTEEMYHTLSKILDEPATEKETGESETGSEETEQETINETDPEMPYQEIETDPAIPLQNDTRNNQDNELAGLHSSRTSNAGDEWTDIGKQEGTDEKERFDRGLDAARESIALEYTENVKGGIDDFIKGREQQFEQAVSDYVYSTYDGFVSVERVNIVEAVEEDEAEISYQIELFAADGNSEIFLCTYHKQWEFYSIYPLADVQNETE